MSGENASNRPPRQLKEGEFQFTLTGSDGTEETVGNDGEGNILFSELTYGAAGIYTYQVKEEPTEEADVIMDDTVYEITVTVTEDESGGLSASAEGADITALDFINRYETGALTVQKTVTGDGGDRERAFTFTVTLSAEGAFPYSGSSSGSLSSGDTVTLKHGEMIEITGLPAGTEYSVTERENDGYTVEASGDTGTILSGQTASASFVNTRAGEKKPGDEKKPDGPATGDPADLRLWGSLAFLSALCLTALFLAGRAKRTVKR